MNLTPELQELLVQVLAGLLIAFAGSETMPFIKRIKSNGLFHFLWEVAKAIGNYNPTAKEKK